MKLDEMLKGTSLIKDAKGSIIVQTIRNMSVAFLTCEPQYSLDDRFGDPFAVKASNRTYGHVRLQNNQAQPVIVAPQAVILTKYAAQNHALPKSVAVRANSAADYNDAGCVEGSQGGTIRGTGEEEIRFVPVSIREMLLDEMGNEHSGYSHLYSAVQTLGRKTNSQTGNYIDPYFKKYDQRLNEFIAHFERPPHCIGVVILIDDEIVAIDKFPSYRYTEQVWDKLVRDCYGSLAIEAELKPATIAQRFTKKINEKSGNGGAPAEMFMQCLDEVLEESGELVQERLQEIMQIDFERKRDRTEGEYVSDKLEHDSYVGQIIRSDDFFHLVSLVKRDRFDAASLRKRREASQKYRELSDSQRAFTI